MLSSGAEQVEERKLWSWITQSTRITQSTWKPAVETVVVETVQYPYD